MSNRLREKYIQDTALAYLEKRYRKYSYNGQVQALKEATTTSGKRADGIIVWKKSLKEVRLVSMEAKSASTVSNLIKRWDQEKLSNWSLIASEGLVLLVFGLLYHYAQLRVILDIRILLLVFVTLHILLKPLRLLLQSQFAHLFQTASVFEQAALYPGNEVWIAIGSDTFKQNREERWQQLRNQCKKKGFGLLEVDHQAMTTIVLHPKFKPAYKANDYLTYYKKDGVIRQQISEGPRKLGFPLHLSRAERFYYFNSFGTSLIGVSFLLLLNFPLDQKRMDNHANPTEVVYAFDETETIPEATPTTYFEEPTRPVISQEEEEAEYVSCHFPYVGSKYLIKDRIVNSEYAAQDRLQELAQLNIPNSDYFYIPCSDIENRSSQWLVYAYSPRTSYEKTLKNLKRYEWILMQANQSSFGVEILLVGELREGFSFK